MTNPKSKEKENKYKHGTAVQSEDKKQREISNGVTICSLVYRDKEVNDNTERTASGLQSFEDDMEYHEIM